MRIAQITDFHLRHHLAGSSPIAERQCRYVSELLPRALECMAGQNVDLIAVTGDLVDVSDSMLKAGEPTDDMLADYRLVKELLDGSCIRYMVLPGNHDLEAGFWRVFDCHADEMEAGGNRVIRFCDHEHEEHRPRRVGDQRRRFDHVLGEVDGRQQIHLQHYVITPALNKSYPHTYDDGDKLAGQIVESGCVRLCLSGHYHVGVEPLVEGGTTFATCPAFCISPFPWRVYDVTADAVSMEQHNLLSEES